jgi:hypothetical protein
MNPTKNLIEPKPYMNPTKSLIETKHYMNPTKNLIELKLLIVMFRFYQVLVGIM